MIESSKIRKIFAPHFFVQVNPAEEQYLVSVAAFTKLLPGMLQSCRISHHHLKDNLGAYRLDSNNPTTTNALVELVTLTPPEAIFTASKLRAQMHRLLCLAAPFILQASGVNLREQEAISHLASSWGAIAEGNTAVGGAFATLQHHGLNVSHKADIVRNYRNELNAVKPGSVHFLQLGMALTGIYNDNGVDAVQLKIAMKTWHHGLVALGAGPFPGCCNPSHTKAFAMDLQVWVDVVEYLWEGSADIFKEARAAGLKLGQLSYYWLTKRPWFPDGKTISMNDFTPAKQAYINTYFFTNRKKRGQLGDAADVLLSDVGSGRKTRSKK